ncbi:MAG: response regulator [Candidatus Margulisiibacteriota bacterium]
MKILIADDEAVIRDTLGDILKKGGDYEVDTCSDGEECLKKAKANLYDLLLLDLEMPKLDGYEILKRVRVMYPDLPVAFITGKGQVNKIMESIAQYKLNAFIEKPFTPEKVLDIVGKLLKPKQPEIKP